MPDRVLPGPVQEDACIREAVCVHTRKVYDSCKDKDCIEDLRLYPTRESQCYIDNAVSVRAKSAKLLYVTIDVEEITFNRGYYTVARLAQRGAHVYMCGRSPTKGYTDIASIKSLYPQAHISLLGIDHLSLSNVVAAATLFLSKENILHGLINNAGILATPFEMTKDGHEAQWQTNYLAHWVFTSHLIPLMLSTSKNVPSGTVRIVNLASSGHFYTPKGGINFTDTYLRNKDGMARYGQSKLSNVLHVKTLNKLYGPGSPSSKAGNGEIWTAAVHPGLVES